MSDSANPVLVTTTRGDIPETLNRASVSVVSMLGKEIFSIGNTATPTYPRSALKFLQVLPLLVSGAAHQFAFSDREIAVMCASHNAEPGHLEAVRSILDKIGLHPSYLMCGAHQPLLEKERIALVNAGKLPEAIHNNCSGKHAGFLALARFLEAPLESYLDPRHPVQRLVRETVSRFCDIPENELILGTDGCAAPNYAMPLRNLATGFVNLVNAHPDDPVLDMACKRVVRAVSSYPFMVAGSERYCTDLMIAAQGRVIAKLGADGIYAMASPDFKVGIAIKVDDGALGPQYNIAQMILEKMGFLPEGASGILRDYRVTPIKNCNGITVGYRKPVESFFEGLPYYNLED